MCTELADAYDLNVWGNGVREGYRECDILSSGFSVHTHFSCRYIFLALAAIK